MTALRVRGLCSGYGAVRVLHGVDLQVGRSELVLLLGRNGSGRSTLLKALIGLIPASGSVRMADRDLLALPAHRRARLGLGYVPEQRAVFAHLTVRQNLRLGAKPAANGAAALWDEVRVFALFPALAARARAPAQALSGGEQQMLALARALIGNPQVLLLDEPTEGLAPQRVQDTAALLDRLRASGVGVLLVEQKPWAQTLADRVVVLGDGRVQFSGALAALPAGVSTAWL